MTEYEETIKWLAKARKNEVFYNSSESHATVVLSSMFENAEHYVHTVCGDLCGDLSTNSEFIKQVENFLSSDPNRKFYVLFDAYNEKFGETKLAKILLKYSEQVQTRRLKDAAYLTYKGIRAHLTISDNRAFRLEINVDDKMAFGNFNDKEKAKIFDDVFNRYFSDDEHTEPIDLTNAA